MTYGIVTGALAQLGERYNGIVEVRGSIPLGSTNPNGKQKTNKPDADINLQPD